MSAKAVDWTNLAMFLVTARRGTLTAAAEALQVNASTVHRRLGQLEEQLGARLFDRSRRGNALTAAGEDLLGRVEAMEREVVAIERGISGRDLRMEGTVRVATVDDMAAIVLPPILADLRRIHPGLTVQILVESALVDLHRMQADVAIRFGNPSPHPDIVARRVGRADVRLCASPAYLGAHGTPSEPDDLYDHVLIRGSEDMAGAPMERFLARYARGTNSSIRTNSMLARVEAVAAGLGISTLSAFCLPRDDIVELPTEIPDLSGPMWLVLHPDMRSNARVRTFMDFVGTRLAALDSSVGRAT